MRMTLPDLATWYWFNVTIRVLAGVLWVGFTCITWRSNTAIGRRLKLCVGFLIVTSAFFTAFKTNPDVSRGIHNVLYIGFGMIAAQSLGHARNGAVVLNIKADALRDAVDALNEEDADKRFK